MIKESNAVFWHHGSRLFRSGVKTVLSQRETRPAMPAETDRFFNENQELHRAIHALLYMRGWYTGGVDIYGALHIQAVIFYIDETSFSGYFMYQ